MNSVNKVQLIGELKNTPEFSEANGLRLARFILITCDYYRIDGKLILEREWHQVVAFGQQATLVMQNLVKGDEVVVDGSIVRRNSTDEKGNKVLVTEVLVQGILFPFTKRA
ncbi:MAG: single-stranded DNA-binding protein [Bacteroidales bacterium]|nr:single-stranded DNA-binding protein [Bacteroidales bacterium]